MSDKSEKSFQVKSRNIERNYNDKSLNIVKNNRWYPVNR